MADPTAGQVRSALAWTTGKDEAAATSETPWEWFWHAIQGDFNDDRSTKQILLDTVISMVPGVDQICDARDLIANCKKLYHDASDQWAWLSLALTLIGLFPVFGSLAKGVMKIIFAYITRLGKAVTPQAIEQSIDWVITFLRRRDVQEYIKIRKIDEVLTWLAEQLKQLRGRIDLPALIKAFDTGIDGVTALVNKVSLIPTVGANAKAVLAKITAVRLKADAGLGQALQPVLEIVDSTILALERRAFREKFGILDANNVHFRGTLPEAAAISLMRRNDHPAWLSDGTPSKWLSAEVDTERAIVDREVAKGWPSLTDSNIKSFHKLIADEIKGPARLFRILSPNSRAMGDCWISEEVFRKLQNAPDPKEAWRKFLAVWPDWNANGQFVIYEVKKGESLKVWRGEASAQIKDGLADRFLEGGYEQIVFKLDRANAANDTMRYYKLKGGNGNILQASINQAAFDKLSYAEKQTYSSVRETINHPNISGPHDTRWGALDFDGKGFLNRIGLPSLPGQITNTR